MGALKGPLGPYKALKGLIRTLEPYKVLKGAIRPLRALQGPSEPGFHRPKQQNATTDRPAQPLLCLEAKTAFLELKNKNKEPLNSMLRTFKEPFKKAKEASEDLKQARDPKAHWIKSQASQSLTARSCSASERKQKNEFVEITKERA